MPMDPRRLIVDLMNLSWVAAEPILEIYESNFDVSIKSDNSPLTLADTSAHNIIVEGLKRLTPPIPIVSEEDEVFISSNHLEQGYFWLVDPLDGTKEFVNRTGEFTVNIALIENGKPILGVICPPVEKVCYSGIVGDGAFKTFLDFPHQHVPIHASFPSNKKETILVMGSRSHANKSTMGDFLSRYLNYTYVGAGSSLKFCHIAEGKAHLYPRFGRTMEWDTAAGQAILEAAGGSVTTLDGIPLTYAKNNFENPSFIASGFSVNVSLLSSVPHSHGGPK